MKSETEERTEQVRQQDAYPANAWGGGAVTTMCNTPLFPFQGQHFRR